MGIVGYSYPKVDPTDTTIEFGIDYSTLPSMGGSFQSGTYYPSTHGGLPAHPACLAATLSSTYSAAQAIQKAVSTGGLAKFGQATVTFVKLFGNLVNTAPFAFLSALFAVVASPEVVVLLAIAGVLLATYLIWKACYAE